MKPKKTELDELREIFIQRLEEKQAQIKEVKLILKNHKTNIESLRLRIRKLEEVKEKEDYEGKSKKIISFKTVKKIKS